MNSNAAKQDAAECNDITPISTATSSSPTLATATSPSTTGAAAAAAAAATSSAPPKNIPSPRKRAKVSFSQEVISKDTSGDGSKVVIKEEHGIFLGPLLGRMMVSSSFSDQGDYTSDEMDECCAADVDNNSPKAVSLSSGGSVISFANDYCHTNDKLSYSESSSHGILKSSISSDSQPSLGIGDNNSSVEYDNLVVQMGLLKCGHRYQTVVPVPDYWKRKTSSSANKQEHAGMDVLIVEDSLDGDLTGEVQAEYANCNDASASSATTICQHHVCITLSARRRGPYRGRFLLELTRHPDEIELQNVPSISSAATETKSNTTATTTTTTSDHQASNNPHHPNKKCLMSLQVDATIMGKDMGTPKLRNGVGCLGKMVGYDSDDETEWQGFD